MAKVGRGFCSGVRNYLREVRIYISVLNGGGRERVWSSWGGY